MIDGDTFSLVADLIMFNKNGGGVGGVQLE